MSSSWIIVLLQALQITSDIGDLLAIKYSKAEPPSYSENDVPLVEVRWPWHTGGSRLPATHAYQGHFIIVRDKSVIILVIHVLQNTFELLEFLSCTNISEWYARQWPMLIEIRLRPHNITQFKETWKTNQSTSH